MSVPFGSRSESVKWDSRDTTEQKCLRPSAAARDHSWTTSKRRRLRLPRSFAVLPTLLPDAHHPLLPFVNSLLPFLSSTSRFCFSFSDTMWYSFRFLFLFLLISVWSLRKFWIDWCECLFVLLETGIKVRNSATERRIFFSVLFVFSSF